MANTSHAQLGDSVFFSDLSGGNILAWHWDFGDGTTDSTQSPTHVYDSIGTYTISLIVTDTSTSDTIVKEHFIEVLSSSNFSGIYNGSVLEGECYGRSFLIDDDGCTLTTGYFHGAVDFDPGPGTTMLSAYSGNGGFLSKTDANGDLLWVRHFVGFMSGLVPEAMDVDSAGNIYLAGHFTGSVDFDPGSAEYIDYAGDECSMFFSKLSTSGEFIWVKSIYGTSNNGSTKAKDLAIHNNSIYLTGEFSGYVNLDPASLISEYYSISGFYSNNQSWIQATPNAFIACYDLDGNYNWSNPFSYTSGFSFHSNYGQSLAFDTLGHVFMVGSYQESTSSFNVDNPECNNVSRGCFIQKYTTSGTLITTKEMESSDVSSANSVFYAHDGNIYVTGYFKDTIDVDPGAGVMEFYSSGEKDFFISKLDNDCNLLWAKSLGGDGNDEAYDILLDSTLNIYITGHFSNQVDFDPGTGFDYHTATGTGDVFLTKFDSLGEFVWTETIGGGAGTDYGYRMAFDRIDNLHIMGRYTPGFSFGNGYPSYSTGGTFFTTYTQHFFANFSSSNSEVFPGDTISFYDLSSLSPTNWLWHFGDGDSSNAKNPVHVYQNPGIYNVSLITWNDWAADSIVKDSFILVKDMQADFVTLDSWVYLGEGCQFEDQTEGNPTNWNWDFGDGDTSSIENPVHIYQNPGSYNVSLAAWNDWVLDTTIKENYIQVNNLEAGFDASDSVVYLGEVCFFEDKTKGVPTLWHWDFGDGTSSSSTDTYRAYQHPGVYSVMQIVSFNSYRDTLIKKNCITVLNLEADFEVSDSAIVLGDSVQFSNLTRGNPASYYWDFGDSNTSNLANPLHYYQQPGTYTITLIASYGLNADTLIKTACVSVAPLQASFVAFPNTVVEKHEFSLLNHSIGKPSTTLWDFGDGNTSTDISPVHFYDQPGVYQISLTIDLWQYSSTYTDSIVVEPLNTTLFCYDSISLTNSPILFNGYTNGNALSWHWDFGDGDFSNSQNIHHTYSDTGWFDVTLIVEYELLIDTVTIPNCVYVYKPAFADDWDHEVNTSNYHTVFVMTQGVEINGRGLGFGDGIAVFYEDGDSLSCGGYGVVDQSLGSQLIFNAYGDAGSVTNPSKTGFYHWDRFYWRIYDQQEDTIYDAVAKYDSSYTSQGNFEYYGLSKVIELKVISSQEIALNQGWNLFSTYIDPKDNVLDSVFSEISQYVAIMKEETGAVYWPYFGIDQVEEFTVGKAYQINMISSESLFVSGILMEPEETPINLESGWSLLGYLRTEPGAVGSMLSSLGSEFVLIKNTAGQIYWPSFNVNQIGNMLPGQGYQIKMNWAQTFTYPANTVSAKSDSPVQPSSARSIHNTGANMTLGLPTSDIQVGEEIIIKTQSGLVVGSGLVSGDFTAITLWGNDEQTTEIDGLQSGEEFIIQLASTQEQVVVDSWQEGDGFYETNKIAIAGKTTRNTKPETFNLFQNNPNPFSDRTEFQFYLPSASTIEFEIYNLLGKRVAVLNGNGELELTSGIGNATVQTLHATSLRMPQGIHTLLFNRKALPAGTYFYRLKTIDENGTQREKTKKMVIVQE